MAGMAAPRDFPRAKPEGNKEEQPEGNTEEQPCQPGENSVLPDSFYSDLHSIYNRFPYWPSLLLWFTWGHLESLGFTLVHLGSLWLTLVHLD